MRTDGDRKVTIERWYDRETRRINKRMRLEASGRRPATYLESVRAYDRDEVTIGARWAGLEVDALYGNFDGDPTNVTANDSSSSATSPDAEPRSGATLCGGRSLGHECPGKGRLPALPTAYLRGQDLDLLTPLRHLAPDGAGRAAGQRSRRRRPVGRRRGAARRQRRLWPSPRRGAGRQAGRSEDPRGGHGPAARALGRPADDAVEGRRGGALGRGARGRRRQMAQAVAVFWVATEDHDFAESAQATFLGHDGPRPSTWGTTRAAAAGGHAHLRRAAAGGDGRAAELLGGGDAVERLRRRGPSTGPMRRFGEAFSRLMVKILGDRAPLFLDAMLPELKDAQAPFLRRWWKSAGRSTRPTPPAMPRSEPRPSAPGHAPARPVAALSAARPGDGRRKDQRAASPHRLAGRRRLRAARHRRQLARLRPARHPRRQSVGGDAGRAGASGACRTPSSAPR